MEMVLSWTFVDTPMVDRLKLGRGSHGDFQVTKLGFRGMVGFPNVPYRPVGSPDLMRIMRDVKIQEEVRREVLSFLEIDWFKPPVGGVAIRDPVSETIPKLPEVVGKAPHDSTHWTSSQPEDDTSEKVVHESSSTTDSERTESGTDASAPKVEKEQGEVMSSTVSSGLKLCSVQTEDQAGSDAGKAHEALAGPDPEPMQEEPDYDQTLEKNKVVLLLGLNPEHMDEDF
ncbi:hypothetical protein Tco_0307339 [Tanacetum coccineum]